MDENFKERAKKIETKIFLWRKYNLSTIGNLSVSQKELLETMQTSIDKFVTRAKHSCISEIRINNKPKNVMLNICYLESSEIHKMHLGIRHVVESFAEVHEAFKKQKDDNVKMYTPLNHLSIMSRDRPIIG